MLYILQSAPTFLFAFFPLPTDIFGRRQQSTPVVCEVRTTHSLRRMIEYDDILGLLTDLLFVLNLVYFCDNVVMYFLFPVFISLG